MDDTHDGRGVSRRDVLRRAAIATGAAVVGGGAVTGAATADAGGRRSHGSLVSRVASHGHYAWFPFGPASWGRSRNPVHVDGEGYGWRTRPASGGGIRCFLSGLPASRNVGFDVHLGALGDVGQVTVESRTASTAAGSSATLFAALFLDTDADGEFFARSDARGNTDAWAGLGGDEEGLAPPQVADGTITLDDETPIHLVVAGETVTLGDLKRGEVAGIDGETAVALYLGLASGGGGTEEVVVESLAVA